MISIESIMILLIWIDIYWIYEDHWGPQPRCTTWPLETTATVSQLLNSDMSCHKVPKNDPLSDCGKPNHSTISYYLSDDFEMFFFLTIYIPSMIMRGWSWLMPSCVWQSKSSVEMFGPKPPQRSTKWRPKNATTSAAGGFPTLHIFVFAKKDAKQQPDSDWLVNYFQPLNKNHAAFNHHPVLLNKLVIFQIKSCWHTDILNVLPFWSIFGT